MNIIYINGFTVVLEGMELDSYSVLQQCDLSDIEIPRFCYHDQLSIAGNCRICVVELSNSMKPVISCATEVSNNMEIYTNSLLVKQARESVLEFLLLNHPLDCPICDQGGECDLQDLSLVYGSDMSRFYYDKRVVSDKNFGPLVKSIMTRCIHCTRCVRFFDEIIGNSLVGTLGRGSSSEIGTFAYDFALTSLYDRRIIDDKLYAFYDFRFITLYQMVGYATQCYRANAIEQMLYHMSHWILCFIARGFVGNFFFTFFDFDLGQLPWSEPVWMLVYYDLNYFEYERFFYTSLGCFDFATHLNDVFNVTWYFRDLFGLAYYWTEWWLHTIDTSFVDFLTPELSYQYLYDPCTTKLTWFDLDDDLENDRAFHYIGRTRVVKKPINSIWLGTEPIWNIKYVPNYFFEHILGDIPKINYNINFYAINNYLPVLNMDTFLFVNYKLLPVLSLVSFHIDRILRLKDVNPQPFYNTEIIGNVIDLCPVGALTSKPYSFTARSWELISTESIDILDSLCSNIRIDSRGSELMRILPRLNALINNEWITDKVRFCYDGLKNDRFLTPLSLGFELKPSHYYWLGSPRLARWYGYHDDPTIPDYHWFDRRDTFYEDALEYRDIYDKYLSASRFLCMISWEHAFQLFRINFLDWFCTPWHSNSAYFFAGHLIDASSFFFFRLFCNVFGISNINIHVDIDVDLRLSYLVSDSISSLFNDSSVFFFVGINLKIESPILNIRIKNNSFSNESSIRIGYLGSNISLNYSFIHLGLSCLYLTYFFYGKSFFCFDLDNVVCLSGSSISLSVNSVFRQLSTSIFSTNYISLYSGDLNLYDLCVVSSYNVKNCFSFRYVPKFIFLLGADFMHHLYGAFGNFIVYVGHTYEAYKSLPNLVLPSCSFVEKEGLYVNCQGKVQITGHAISSSDSVWTNELIMYSLLRYTCRDYIMDLFYTDFLFKFYSFDELNFSFDHYFSIFSLYFPYKLNFLSNNFVCVYLLSFSSFRNFFFLFSNVFILLFRWYYESDIISRRTYYVNVGLDFHKSLFNNYI